MSLTRQPQNGKWAVLSASKYFFMCGVTLLWLTPTVLSMLIINIIASCNELSSTSWLWNLLLPVKTKALVN